MTSTIALPRNIPLPPVTGTTCGYLTVLSWWGWAAVNVDDPDHEPVPALRCELERGHSGDHGCFAQSWRGGNVQLWATWTTVDNSLVKVGPGCPHGDADRDDICLLWDGHPGRHSFELPNPTNHAVAAGGTR